jgi:hypothetical protein
MSWFRYYVLVVLTDGEIEASSNCTRMLPRIHGLVNIFATNVRPLLGSSAAGLP